MSPASAGCPLEVERYIGACLISQNRKFARINNNSNNQEYYHNREFLPHRQQRLNPNPFRRCHPQEGGGWADGVPLISFTNRQSSWLEQERQDPLARLAVHTVQGAPLIVTKSFNHRKNKQQRSTRVYENSSIKKQNQQQSQLKSTDTVSVTSDESSASSNVSENCLPRIIKPRKRRKKDRKPPPLLRPPSQESFSTDSASPDIVDARTYAGFAPFVVDALQDISETPKLHHRFEDVEEPDKDINGNQCQCRYCDPSGQIWDVDRDCYSPFLTPPLNRNGTFHYPNFHSSPVIVELERGMSSVSLEDDRDRDVNKNWIGKIPPSRSSSSSSCRDLEVSTEIVTSLNGHRDLEIKFFSTPSVN